MKRLILLLTAVTFYLTGCSAIHYQVRQYERVTFYLRAPGVEKVEFVSSLDAYNPQRASKLNCSRWAVTVVPNSEFRYFYILDGSVYLPECELYEKDDFGSLNCVYVPEK